MMHVDRGRKVAEKMTAKHRISERCTAPKIIDWDVGARDKRLEHRAIDRQPSSLFNASAFSTA